MIALRARHQGPPLGCFTLLKFCVDIKYIQLLHVVLGKAEGWTDIPTIMSRDAGGGVEEWGGLLTTAMSAEREREASNTNKLFPNVYPGKLVLDKSYYNPTSHTTKQSRDIANRNSQFSVLC